MSKLKIFFDGTAYPIQKQDDWDDQVSLQMNRSVPYCGRGYTVLLLPADDNGMKRKLEGFMELMTIMGHALSNNKPEYGSPMTENKLHIQLAHVMKGVANFLGYLENSTSWKDQEIKEYDRQELIDRLSKIQEIIKRETYA